MTGYEGIHWLANSHYSRGIAVPNAPESTSELFPQRRWAGLLTYCDFILLRTIRRCAAYGLCGTRARSAGGGGRGVRRASPAPSEELRLG
jgi:hypothetical protein